MDPAGAFLADICEHPDDDAPRLVYADWLEEHGQPERAEFIRVQCELARRGEYDPASVPLRRRGRQLWHEHGGQWLREVPAWARRWPEFRRGFLAAVRCTVSALARGGRALARRAPVEEVTLDVRADWPLVTLAQLPALARVSALALRSSTLGKLGVGALADSPHLGGLRRLHLQACRLAPPGVEALAGSPALGRLTGLRLVGVPLGREGAAALAGSRFLNGLTALGLSWGRFGDAGVAELAKSAWVRRLVELTLSGNDIRAEGLEPLTTARGWSRLRALDLSFNRLGDAEAEALARWPPLANIAQLHLSGNRITAEGLEALLEAGNLGGLKAWLMRNPVGDRGAEALAGCPHLGNLTYLDLWNAHIGEKGVQALLASPYLSDGMVVNVGYDGMPGAEYEGVRRRLRKRFTVGE
jgi:uncharacterized protein (TIGR02996 family)